MITWQCKAFSELTNLELYKILQLRNEVFVVEQNCPYQDCDNKDIPAYHLCAWQNETLVAYSRLLPQGISYPEAVSIGRVITSPTVRRQDLGKQLMTKSIDQVYHLFGKMAIIIGAQLYLKKFYESLGFVQIDDGYVEDGIPHIHMKKNI
jgi:ElaA protein